MRAEVGALSVSEERCGMKSTMSLLVLLLTQKVEGIRYFVYALNIEAV